MNSILKRLFGHAAFVVGTLASPLAAQAAPSPCGTTLYTCSDAVSSYIPVAGTGSIATGDDYYFNQTPPFPVKFAGNTFNNVILSTNGAIYMGSIDDGWMFNYVGGVYPFATDLVVDGNSSTLRAEVRGDAPNRQWVVEWGNAWFWWMGPNGPRVSTQAIFHENGDLTYQYSGIDPNSSYENGAYASTVGLFHGSEYFYYNHVGGRISDQVAIRWTGVQPDATAPQISITTPASGAGYKLGQAVAANYGCTDVGGSGLATCVGPVVNGAAIDTSTVGAKSFKVDASDNAGNSSSLTSLYAVTYNFTGFFSPVDRSTGRDKIMNSTKAGQSVPVKFSLAGNQGMNIFAEGYPKSKNVACSETTSEDPLEEVAAPGSSGLAYDATADRYSLVWKTEKAWAGTCRILTVKLKDNSEHSAYFRFTK
jgi:hypothetical protein